MIEESYIERLYIFLNVIMSLPKLGIFFNLICGPSIGRIGSNKSL